MKKSKKSRKKTVGQMIAYIERKKSIYDIHFCRAGVGFLFYKPPKGFKITKNSDWRKYLTVEKYYKNITEATKAEYKNAQQ